MSLSPSSTSSMWCDRCSLARLCMPRVAGNTLRLGMYPTAVMSQLTSSTARTLRVSSNMLHAMNRFGSYGIFSQRVCLQCLVACFRCYYVDLWSTGLEKIRSKVSCLSYFGGDEVPLCCVVYRLGPGHAGSTVRYHMNATKTNCAHCRVRFVLRRKPSGIQRIHFIGRTFQIL